MSENIREQLCIGPLPEHDGWRWLYRLYSCLAGKNASIRKIVSRYFWPAAAERRIYRTLGVKQFGRFVPTGGIGIRRLTGSRMAPYTLRANSVSAAREFFYRTCVFETLHLPFCITLFGLSAHRLLTGRADLAFENLAVNLVFNVYPIMHHRNTRYRIVELLKRDARQTR